MIRFVAALMGSLLLFGCGTAANSPGITAIRTTVDRLANPPTAPVPLREQRAQILADVNASQPEGPILLVELAGRNVAASMVPIARNNGAITWLDQTGVSVVTRDGILIATRGLGDDLMATDPGNILLALSGQASEYSRQYRHLTGEGALTRHTVRCRTNYTPGHVTEQCDEGRITNEFWVRGGTAWTSKQWVSSGIGYARLERLQ